MTHALETRAETSKTRQMFEANEMKVLRKLVGKTKIANKSENPAVSNLLMSECKEEEEEENGTNM